MAYVYGFLEVQMCSRKVGWTASTEQLSFVTDSFHCLPLIALVLESSHHIYILTNSIRNHSCLATIVTTTRLFIAKNSTSEF